MEVDYMNYKLSKHLYLQKEPPQEQIIGVLANTFILTKIIGIGTTSEVFLGYCPQEYPHKCYSFKIFRPNYINSFNLQQVINEISMLQSISSNNVIKIYHHGEAELKLKESSEEKKVFFLQLEYIENGELFDYIYISRGGFGEAFGKIIFTSLLDAVEAVHSAGIVHRDIKADNIMLSKDYTIKLVDFGFATRQTEEKLTDYKGTPNYCSPSVLECKPYNGIANDVFSLGVTIFAIVTGNFPFKTIRRPNGNLMYWVHQKFCGVSEAFKQMINAMLNYDETLRPSISEIRKSEWMKDVHMELLPKLKERFMYLSRELKPHQDKMVKEKQRIHYEESRHRREKGKE